MSTYPISDESAIVVSGIPFLGLYSTPEGESCAAFAIDGRYEVASVRSPKLRSYVRLMIHNQSGRVATDSTLKEYLGQIAAHCEFYGKKISLSVRTARDRDDFVVDGVNQAYRITANGWFREQLDKPLFKRPEGLLELPLAQEGGDLRELLSFSNIRNEEARLLFLVHVVAAFIPDIPHPPLVIYGPQGASKSTILRLYCSLVDPALNEEVPYRNEKEFMLAAGQRWVVGMDNVSFLDTRVSDIFCKLVTGASYSARVLYADEELLIRRFRRVVILNGVNLPIDKPDLMDRCLLLPLDRILSHHRQTEAEINARFQELKPRLLGACFDALSKAMAIYPSIKLPAKERMADFHVWGCAIAEALGFTKDQFLHAWAKNVELQHEEVLEASPLAALVTEWFRCHPRDEALRGTPTQVFKDLRGMAERAGVDERSLPRTPLSFGRKLEEVRANLEAHGYVLGRTRGKCRTVTIHRPVSEMPSSIASFPSLRVKAPVPSSDGVSGPC
jgi:hypothetical protein